jgi:hypothetical protein
MKNLRRKKMDKIQEERKRLGYQPTNGSIIKRTNPTQNPTQNPTDSKNSKTHFFFFVEKIGIVFSMWVSQPQKPNLFEPKFRYII